MGKVRAVCISEKRGTQKKNIESAVFVENWGIEGDAHAGNWHRQISLLSEETIAAFKARGAEVTDGAFGENLVVSGYDFTKFPVGTRFTCKDVVLELTQIGKECHHGCEIFQKNGRVHPAAQTACLRKCFTAEKSVSGMNFMCSTGRQSSR